MPAFLKDLKKIMKKDKGKAGKTSDGEYKYIPPKIISRDIKDYTILKVSRLDVTPDLKRDLLEFEGVVSSESKAGLKYRVILRFHDVGFKPEQTEKSDQSVKVLDKGKKKLIYYPLPKIRFNQVSMKCQCKDFQHRFSHQLADVDSLVGKPIPYKRKTPEWPDGYPYVNSTDKQGFCKHIHSMVEYLKKKDLIKE